jgi:hypothetical protein
MSALPGGAKSTRHRVDRVTRKALPQPEWWEEFRLLHVNYERRLEAIRALDIPEEEKRSRGMDLWFETEQNRKRLMKAAIPKLQCTMKPTGERCSKTARPDYFGQKCSSHAPHIEDSRPCKCAGWLARSRVQPSERGIAHSLVAIRACVIPPPQGVQNQAVVGTFGD